MADLAGMFFRIASLPWAQSIFWAIVLAIATHIVSRLTAGALRHFLNQDSNPLPSSSIIVNIARGTIWILGASIILDACFNVNVNAVVAALGVGGIAISLGFQDTLSNLIGGLQVTFMRIIKPGDNIEVGTSRGIVQDVTWRHTTIRDTMGQIVVVPNSIISKTALVHLLPASRVVVPFAIPHQDDEGKDRTHMLDELADEIAEIAREAAERISPIVDGPATLFTEISEFGIKGRVVMQIQDVDAIFDAADAVVRAIARQI